MMILDNLGHKLLLRLSPEIAHDMGVQFMARGIFAPGRYATTTSRTTLFGVELDNPLGLAAGFDKNGELTEEICDYGFGYIEIGSVTFRGGKGNDKPRLFRLREQRSLLNRMGLNGKPAHVIADRLAKVDPKVPFGVNIAKTHNPKIVGFEAIEDISFSYDLLRNFGFYTVINISCPNTTEGKTFEDNPDSLRLLLQNLYSLKQKPLLIKLSPTLRGERLDAVIETAEPFVDGYVCGNTLPSNHENISWVCDRYGKGGVSGVLLNLYAYELIRNVRARTSKTIIGVGGISNGKEAFDALRAGANALQAYTGFIYGGTKFAHEVNRGLDFLIKTSKQ